MSIINIIDGFKLGASTPIDDRIVASNSTVRNAITYKYDGLKVFQLDNRKSYVWNVSTLSWSFDNQLVLTDGFLPMYSTSISGLTNSPVYSTGSSVGINTIIPKSALQINDVLGLSSPFNIGYIGSEVMISSNYYNDGLEKYHNLNKGSSIISLSDDKISMRVRKASDVANAFTEPFLLTKTNLNINNNLVNITSGTTSINGVIVNINGTNSVNILGGTTSITGTNSVNIIGSSRLGVGSVININSGNGINPGGFGGVGGGVSIKAGDGQSSGGAISIKSGDSVFNGLGGFITINTAVLIKSGYSLGTPGYISLSENDISIIPGGDGQLPSSSVPVIIGTDRIKITDNDLYASVHNKGLDGIGDSGNEIDPWDYPSISGGSYYFPGGGFTNLVNCSLTASTQPCLWHRTGNTITVSGEINLTILTASIITKFNLKTPIASKFGDNNTWQLNGLGKVVDEYGVGDVISIQSNGNSRAGFNFKPSTSGIQKIKYHYTYLLGDWPNGPIPIPPGPLPN